MSRPLRTYEAATEEFLRAGVEVIFLFVYISTWMITLFSRLEITPVSNDRCAKAMRGQEEKVVQGHRTSARKIGA